MDFFANFKILFRAILDAHRLGKNFVERFSIGLLRQLQISSLRGDSRHTSVGKKFSWNDLQLDFFANFKVLPRAILDAHRLGKFRGAIFDGLLCQLPK